MRKCFYICGFFLFGSIALNGSEKILRAIRLSAMIPRQVTQRFIKDQRCAEQHAAEVREEWARFALLASGNKVPMLSRQVDEFWHTFLLFTRDYDTYCEQFLGQKLHHQPIEPGNGCPQICQRPAQMAFIKMYKEQFDMDPEPSIWTGLEPCSDCKNKQGGSNRVGHLAVLDYMHQQKSKPMSKIFCGSDAECDARLGMVVSADSQGAWCGSDCGAP